MLETPQEDDYSTGGKPETTCDADCTTGGMLETTQDDDYSTGGMPEIVYDANYYTEGISLELLGMLKLHRRDVGNHAGAIRLVSSFRNPFVIVIHIIRGLPHTFSSVMNILVFSSHPMK